MSETLSDTDVKEPVVPEPVEIRSVHKSYGNVSVLRGVDLDIHHGETVCVIGPSGSGKSTLLRCVNHLETIQRGRIKVYGELVGYSERRGRLIDLPEKEIARRRLDMGMVFQRFNLFPHMTALRNVTLGLTTVGGVSRAEANERGRELLARVGLADKSGAYPSELSGGQQQRVAIARALAMRPRLLLLDEPTSALDPELVGEVLDVIRSLAEEGMTMMIVTHEISFARDVCDRVVFMDEGVVVEQGSPSEVLQHPSNPRTISFLSRIGEA